MVSPAPAPPVVQKVEKTPPLVPKEEKVPKSSRFKVAEPVPPPSSTRAEQEKVASLLQSERLRSSLATVAPPPSSAPDVERALSPAPKEEKVPRSLQFKMAAPAPSRSESPGSSRERIASLLQPVAPPPMASPKAPEGLPKEGLAQEDLPSLSAAPLTPGTKGKTAPAPTPKGLTVGSLPGPREGREGGSASPPSWLASSRAEGPGQRSSTEALASLARPEKEEAGLSRPATPLFNHPQSAGAARPKASTVPLLAPPPASAGEEKKGTEGKGGAPYLLGEKAPNATGAASGSQKSPIVPPAAAQTKETFTPSTPMARGGVSPKGVGMEPLLSQDHISLSTKDPQWAPYTRNARDRITRAWNYPEDAESVKGVVEVSFAVERDGSITQVRITKSSGHPILDRVTVEALTRASPLQPLPPEVRKRSVWFDGKFNWGPK